ncbi:uncharacterized protein LOC117914062 [Vitis riparia]|uniref:uncharacterized protein LOC117914062 n=1 Tax=Vitis riparia TaxID=96939 RepID=UPI00155A5306|nr:uncharacterized protein LOC117914062 [Vitis riparia]
MAANSSSKKRKQPSSTGIFTRSKSQVHIGGNRSGRKRLLTTPTTTFQWSDLPQGKPRGRYGPRSRLDEGQISHIAIKDLRAHRVFSCCNLDTDKPQILKDGCGYPDGTASLEGKVGVESLSPDRNLDDSTESSRDDPKAAAMKENAGFCDEKNGQMTPPDADIFSKPEADEGEGNGAQCVSQSTENILLKQPSGSIRKNDSMSRSRSVLNPCSRLKLFKTPGSFSYRRLLPYLMDIAKENSCASKNVQCPKPEMGLEEKPHPSLLASHNEEMCENKLNVNSFQIEGNNVDSGALHTATLTPSEGSINDKKLDLISDEHLGEPQIALDSQKERESQIERVKSDESSRLEPPNDNLTVIQGTDQPDTLPCIVTCEALSREKTVVEVCHQPSVDTEENCVTPDMELITNVKSSDTINFEQNSLQVEAFAPSGFPDARLQKGILKRNPRGCRGLCSCLNCASFRLHAERAFEFSRNQMQDAEEVAVELMKELSYLRKMLEESAVGASNDAFVHVNQVKDACEKASNAAELAKERLKQMNYDLNIHCRITCLQRPRVTFSNYVNEKVITKTSLSSK